MTVALNIAPVGANTFSFGSTPIKKTPIINQWHNYVLSKDPILNQLEKENTAWVKFKEFFHKNSQLCKDIIALSKTSSISSNELPKIIESFSSPDYQRLRQPLRKIILSLNIEQRTELFNGLIQKHMESSKKNGLINCIDLIAWDEIEQMVNGTGDSETILKCLAACEAESRKNIENISQMTTKSTLGNIGNFIHSLIDTILMSFSFFEAGKEPGSSWEASHVLKTYLELIGAPMALFAALSAVVPVLTAIYITTAIILAVIIAIIAYVKWLKPCPDFIEPCINLTKEAKEGHIEPVVGRDVEIEKLIQCLSSANEGSRAHPILSGPSGSGKTEIVKGLALRIAQGRVPDILKDKKVFMINTSQLSDKTYDTQDRISRIISRLGKHKRDAIIFFDEIQTVMKDKNDKLCQRLKTVLDTSPESLPYCIAATNEYDTYIKNDPAFTRRFEKIDVSETTKDQTLWILRELAQKEAADLQIPEEFLEKIYDTTKQNKPKESQPAISKRVLSKAIAEMRNQLSGYRSSDELSEKRAQKDALMSAFRINQDFKLMQKIVSVEKEISVRELEKTNEKDRLKKLDGMYKYRAEQKNSLLKLAYDAVNGLNKNDEHFKESAKKFIRFTQEYLLPKLDAEIDKKQKSMKLKCIEDLISVELAKL